MDLHPEIAKILKHYHEKRLAHAFLIESNNLDYCLNELIKLVKYMCCKKEFSNSCNEECNICNLIDNKSLPSLVVIEPDGITIKKSQILNLKERFLSNSLYTENNIYIVKNCEKLNSAAANSMLKFLEEPDGQVIGFFLTVNKKNVLPTIISRCQYININYSYEKLSDKYSLDEETYLDYIGVIKIYLQKMEIDKEPMSLYNKEYFLSIFDERQKVEKALLMMLGIYENIFRKKNNIKFDIIIADEFSFLMNLTLKQIVLKINLIKRLLDDQEYNLNLELFLDRLAIEMGRI